MCGKGEGIPKGKQYQKGHKVQVCETLKKPSVFRLRILYWGIKGDRLDK